MKKPLSLFVFEMLEDRIAPATITVDSLTDDGTGMTLRDAIAEANSTPGADTIVFAPGIVSEGATITLTGGELPILAPLTIKGPGLDRLIIDANNASRVFNINDGTSANIKVTISGLTITNGQTALSGGGIFNTESLKLDRVAVVDNETTFADGGGIYSNTPGKAQVSVTNSILSGNAASSIGGGGIFLIESGKLIIKNTSIVENTAATAGGLSLRATPVSSAPAAIQVDGAVISSNTATTSIGGLDLRLNSGDGLASGTVKNTSVLNNEGVSIAGVYSAMSAGPSTLKVTNATITNNFTNGVGAGGGWRVDHNGLNGKVDFINSTISDNSSSTNGGGLKVVGSGGVVSLKGTSIEHNYSGLGGGIHLSGGAKLVVSSNSLINGNDSGGFGGGVYVDDSNLTMKGGQIASNFASGNGGGFYATGATSEVSLSNVKVSANRLAAAGSGAGFALDAISKFSMTQGSLVGNRAVSLGGGFSASDIQDFKMTGTRIEGNMANVGGGGFISNAGAYEMTSVKILGNSANLSAGGLNANGDIGSTLKLDKSFVQGNTAGTDGGGLSFANGMTHTVIKTIVVGNTALGDGGGLYISNSGGTSSFSGGRVSENYAFGSGGGLYNNGLVSVNLVKNPVTGNFAPNSVNIFGPVSIS